MDKKSKLTITLNDIISNEQSNIIIYNTIDGKASVALYAKDGKLDIDSVIKDYLITAADGVLTFNGKDVLQGNGLQYR